MFILSKNSMYNLYFFLILWITIIFFLFDKFVDYLNTKNWSEKLPLELDWIYDEEKYKKSQRYEKDIYKFKSIIWSIWIILNIIILIFFWFWRLDLYLRQFTDNQIYLGLLFFWIIYLFSAIISIPSDWYRNFKIEEKYQFNKMTLKTFFLDTLKNMLVSLIILWALLSLIIWFYSLTPDKFWIYAWLTVTIFSLLMSMFYSNIIVPLFNKQTPLKDSELRQAIEDFSKKVWFKLDNIYEIDWSKRTTKANAYFTWLWNKKRIVLYDNLIKDYSKEEIVSVLAHEIGHYKKKHTLKMLIFSILQMGVILYLSSLIIPNKQISLAL